MNVLLQRIWQHIKQHKALTLATVVVLVLVLKIQTLKSQITTEQQATALVTAKADSLVKRTQILSYEKEDLRSTLENCRLGMAQRNTTGHDQRRQVLDLLR